MIETLSDYNNFLQNLTGNLILDVIPTRGDVHPCDTNALILFIYVLDKKKCYSLSINHPDSKASPEVGNLVFRALIDYDGKKFVLNSKIFNQLIYCGYVFDINLYTYLDNNEIIDTSNYDTPAHKFVKSNSKRVEFYNKSIPLLKHQEMFVNICEDICAKLNRYKNLDGYKYLNDVLIPSLREVEYNGLCVDRELFTKYFEADPPENNIVRCQYNVYTTTGRPSNTFNGINYSALNTSDGSRSCFISRHLNEGSLIEFDYSSFHPQIASMLINYKIDGNIYEYLAKLYFNKHDISPEDIIEAKQLTFKQFYGGIDKKYLHIKYLSVLNFYIMEKWSFFKENKYVLTPLFNKRITQHHIKDATPYKLFNYILQATESELINTILLEVHVFLRDYKTKPVLTTYDSILFDVYNPELPSILSRLKQIISFNNNFPIKVKQGNNYNNLSVISY